MIRIVDTERITKKISIDETSYPRHSTKVWNSIRDAPVSSPLMEIVVELPEDIVFQALPRGKQSAVSRLLARLRSICWHDRHTLGSHGGDECYTLLRTRIWGIRYL